VDSLTEVTEDNLLGDKFINIHPGIAKDTLKAGDELFAKPPSNDFDPADLIATLKQALNQVNGILDAIDDPTTTVGALVKGDALYTQVRAYFVAMQNTIHQMGNPKSPAGQAIFGTELYDQLRGPLIDIDKQLAAIENGEGELGHFYASTEQYDKVRAQVGDFRKSVAEMRKNPLLTDGGQYEQWLATLRKLNLAVAELANSPGFENAQMYESLSGSAKSAENFLREFRQNPQKFLRIKVF
jgi:phospholipid/cholesterol/gamma-HCH transport system substrate-binding protein